MPYQYQQIWAPKVIITSTKGVLNLWLFVCLSVHLFASRITQILTIPKKIHSKSTYLTIHVIVFIKKIIKGPDFAIDSPLGKMLKDKMYL